VFVFVCGVAVAADITTELFPEAVADSLSKLLRSQVAQQFLL
jgi:hypothetical protein